MRKTKILISMLVFSLFVGTQLSSGQTVIPGNPNFEVLVYDFGFKPQPEPPPSGTYTFPDGINSVTITSDGTYFDWTSTLGIDAVIVKGAPNANVYYYDPESFNDTGLHAPINPNNNKPYAISHIEFCYDYKVDVSKTAKTTFTRTWEWNIKKTVTPEEHYLFSGETGTSTYTVLVDKTGYTDSNWSVEGTITISNNTPFDAIIESVVDIISGFDQVTTDCEFPYVLPAGDELVCTYASPLPNGTDRTNTATVTTSGIVRGGEAEAAVTFGNPTTEVNKDVNITDTNDEFGGPKTFNDDASWNYDKTFNACSGDPTNYDENGTSQTSYKNIATIVETEQTADATVTVYCYIPLVSKDASTTFTRGWDWNIVKSANKENVTLSLGQELLVNYNINLTAKSADSKFAVDGTITVKNPNPKKEMTVTLADVVSPDIVAALDCGGSLTVPADGSATCNYSASLPNGSARTNTATATLKDFNFTGTVDVVFDLTNPTEENDECINVSDTYVGDLGEVCKDATPIDLKYSRYIGPYDECGNYTVGNIASFMTNDTEIEDSHSWTVNVSIPCGGGCTLTPGYWKTHSLKGPAPLDNTWTLLDPDQEKKIFFESGQTYYDVLWTTPKGGNAYYILAHAYIAAELNRLNGADFTAALAAFTEATGLFELYTPEYITILKGKTGNELRVHFISLASTLDDYNNGLIGPGHCDEDDNTGAPRITINKKSRQSSEESNESTIEKTVNSETEVSKDQKSTDVQEQKKDVNEKQTVELNKASNQPTNIVEEIPIDYLLMQNHPNPFNPSTTISFNLPKTTKATLTIFNVSGQKVATLVSDYLNAGHYSYQWNIPNNLPAGIYLYRLETAEFTSTKQMIFLK